MEAWGKYFKHRQCTKKGFNLIALKYFSEILTLIEHYSIMTDVESGTF